MTVAIAPSETTVTNIENIEI